MSGSSPNSIAIVVGNTMGVEEETATQDTEGIVHYIQPITVHKIAKLVEFLRKNPKQMKAIRDYTER